MLKLLSETSFSMKKTFIEYYLEMTLLSSRMSDYPTITQGKTRIPGINDGEEFEQTDVSALEFGRQLFSYHV